MTAEEKQVVFDRTVARLAADRRATGKSVVAEALSGVKSDPGDDLAEFVSDLDSTHYTASNPLQLIAMLEAVSTKHGINGEATDMVVAWRK